MYSSITKQYLSENTPHHKNMYSFPTTSILTRTYLHVQYNTIHIMNYGERTTQETPRRRITVTSSLNEISTEQVENEGGGG
jgi:hypothetical protein